MTKIQAADVAKLRKQTGAGMMDCKKALTESNGDFEMAIDILRKKGQKVAAKRADREAKEGVVLAKNNENNTKAIIVSLNCETDFVAKNTDFIDLAHSILDAAIENNISTNQQLQDMSLNGMSISDKVIEQTGVIGEKIEVSMETVEGAQVSSYIHAGSKLATIVSFNDTCEGQVLKDVAMQVAAMNPLAVNKDEVDESVVNREIEVGKEKARQEGKPEEMLEKIAIGRLNKFFKENTLLNQEFIKNNKQSVDQYLKEHNSNLTALEFKRVALGN